MRLFGNRRKVTVQSLRSILLSDVNVGVSALLGQDMSTELILEIVWNLFYAELVELLFVELFLLLMLSRRHRTIDIDFIYIFDDFSVASVVLILYAHHLFVIRSWFSGACDYRYRRLP